MQKLQCNTTPPPATTMHTPSKTHRSASPARAMRLAFFCASRASLETLATCFSSLRPCAWYCVGLLFGLVELLGLEGMGVR